MTVLSAPSRAAPTIRIGATASSCLRPTTGRPLRSAGTSRPAPSPRRVSKAAAPARAVASPENPTVLVPAAPSAEPELFMPGSNQEQVSMVMKFGGSSVASAARMREVAKIVCMDPNHFPAVVLSAMGKTTNLLLAAGEAALTARADEVRLIPALVEIRELHEEAAADLGVGPEVIAEVRGLLAQLEQLLVGVCIMQDLTARARDSLVSFGERMSVRVFAGYLRSRGVPARAVDAPDAGVVTDDAFTAAEVNYELSLPAIRDALRLRVGGDSDAAPAGEGGATGVPAAGHERALPIVTGFLGRGLQTRAVTTLGRGGSDLTCTLLGAALRLPEVQVWKDVDGVLTGDPRVLPAARPVPALTYDEASELAFFGATVLHPHAMHPARHVAKEGVEMSVRVKNSYNVHAPGTKISACRGGGEIAASDAAPAVAIAPVRADDDLMTSIVLKSNVTLVDIVSVRMLGQVGFLEKVFRTFAEHEISVDVIATSEVSISLTLDPAKTLWSRDLIEEELDHLVEAFEGVAEVSYRRGVSIVCLVCDVAKSSIVLERVFDVLRELDINVLMMSQGASKNNISLIIRDDQAKVALPRLHAEFFE